MMIDYDEESDERRVYYDTSAPTAHHHMRGQPLTPRDVIIYSDEIEDTIMSPTRSPRSDAQVGVQVM